MHVACSYTVAVSQPATHFFQVSLRIDHPNAQGQQLWLPNWIPGSYMIRDFARHIVSVRAQTAQGLLLAVNKLAKNRWQIEPHVGPIEVFYDVYAWDLSVRAAHLDQTHGYFNGTSLLLAVAGQEQQPHHLHLHHPIGVENWRVATSMSALEVDESGFGGYQADNYAELIDHPIEMGAFSEIGFVAANTPHRVVITGKHRADMPRLADDLTRICQAAVDFWQDIPFDRYLFQVMAVGNGYGGLEHKYSTSLLCSRDDLPLSTEPKTGLNEKYKGFLGLCSHEYFHSWLVKRIQPTLLQQPDLEQENYTELLWLFEGITSYYDDLLLVRAGVISVAEYLDMLAQQITRYMKGLGRFKQTVTESSWDAWSKYYKPDENTPNSVVSYYIKGALIALCMDLKLRQLSQNRLSLDNIMRQLWRDYGKVGRGVENDTLMQLVQEQLAALAITVDLTDFWQLCLYQTEELPLSELLQQQGVIIRWRNDLAGERVVASLGVRGQMAEGGYQLQTVWRGGAAEAAGLSAGDVIIAVDGLKVTSQFEKTIASYAVGANLSIYAFRRDELMPFHVCLQAAPHDVCQLTLPAETQQQATVVGWVKGQ